MASFLEYTADGADTKTGISIATFKKEEIKVRVDGVLKTEGSGQDYEIIDWNTNGFTIDWKDSARPTSPSIVNVYRVTDYSPAQAVYSAGSSVKASDLNDNQTQVLRGLEEADDQLIQTWDIRDGAVQSDQIRDGTIVNVDINAAAEIDVTKLGNGSNNQVIQSDASGAVGWVTNVDLPGTLTVASTSTFSDNINLTADNKTFIIEKADGTNKFSVSSQTGNTDIAGAITVWGNSLLVGDVTLWPATNQSKDFKIKKHDGTDQLTVNTDSGATVFNGTVKLQDEVTFTPHTASDKLAFQKTDGTDTLWIWPETSLIQSTGLTDTYKLYSRLDSDFSGPFDWDNTTTGNFTLTNKTTDPDTKMVEIIPGNTNTIAIDATATSITGGTTTVLDNLVVKADNKEFAIQNASGTDKFTVDTDNGNTVIVGTLTSSGTVTTNGSAQFKDNLTLTADNKEFTIEKADGTNTFTVDTDNGNTVIAGTLNVTGEITGNCSSATKLTDAATIIDSEQASTTPTNSLYYSSKAADERFWRQTSAESILDGATWVSNDNYVASTAAIDDRIVDLVDDVGGFWPIANETSFPTSNPDVNNGPGTIISIRTMAATREPTAGVVTIDNGAGTGVTVTIVDCGTTNLSQGYGVLVETTSTLHNYQFHRLTPKATEVTTIAGSIANINTIASNIADINTVADDLNEGTSEIDTVATNITNVNNVGGSIANVNSVAANLSTVNDFGARYRAATNNAGEYSSDNDVGDLYFNTTINALKVYNGSAWVAGVTDTGDYAVVTGNTFTGSNVYNDDVKAIFGTSSDGLEIYHGNNESYINDSGTGNLKIQTGGSTKLEITSAGATVTGVLTATLSDDSVGLAQLATGTQGGLLYYGASGAPSELAAGTSGYYLKTNGSGANPAWSEIIEDDGNWTLGNSGTAHFTFTGTGYSSAQNDPDIRLLPGHTYRFINGCSAGTNPFTIQEYTSGSWSSVTDGITNNGATGGNTLTWTVPFDAPPVLRYINTGATDMTGNIFIENPRAGVQANVNYTTNGTGSLRGFTVVNGYAADATASTLFFAGYSNTGSKGFIDSPLFPLLISSGTITLKNNAEDFTFFNATNGGITSVAGSSVSLYHDSHLAISTDANGCIVKGPEGGSAFLYLYADEGDDNADKYWLKTEQDGTGFHIQNSVSGSTQTNLKAVGEGAVELYYDNKKRLATANGGTALYGDEAGDCSLFFNADEGDDNADIWKFVADADGGFTLFNYASGSYEKSIACGGNGNVQLYYDNSKHFETTTDGVTVTGDITFTGNVYGGDGDKIRLGGSQDLELYHADGNSFTVHGDTGNYLIKSGNDIYIRTGGDDSAIDCVEDGAVKLYYNNAKKAETVTGGFTVTGTCTATAFAGDGSALTGISAGTSLSGSTNDTVCTVTGANAIQGESNVRIDSSGRVLIGTTSAENADSMLTVTETSGHCEVNVIAKNDSGSVLNFGDSDDYNVGRIKYDHSSNYLEFDTDNTERARIDSSGNLGIGTTNPNSSEIDANALCVHAYKNATNGALFKAASSNATLHMGALNDHAQIRTHTANPLKFGTDGTIRCQIGSSGDWNYAPGTFHQDPADNGSSSTQGMTFKIDGTDARLSVARNGGHPLSLGRQDNDGDLIQFFQDGSLEGNIGVSGSSVSLNGGHLTRWSQLNGLDPLGAKSLRPTILRGTVMSNLDEMCEWKKEARYKEGDTIPAGSEIGSKKEPRELSTELEDNEQLNQTKISDTEGDKNVAGVFQGWDDNEGLYTNDYYIAMTGDFVIRIGKDTTVARGDLLMSAGDGTAKPQDDDIIRSKTIAKVISTTKSTTYSDGSYCVPCVLMAC